MIERLTPEQERLMVTIRDKWINFSLLEGDDIDEAAAQKGIEWMYDMTGLDKPQVLVVDSPLAVQYAANIVTLEGYKASEVRSKVASKVRSEVASKVASEVRSEVDSKVASKVASEVHSEVYSKVASKVASEVHSEVYSKVASKVDSEVASEVASKVASEVRSEVDSKVASEVRSEVASKVASEVRSEVDSEVASGNMRPFPVTYESLGWAAGWASYLDFYAQIGVTDHEGLKKYLDYLKSGVFYGVFLDGLAIVCRRPKAVRRDTEHELDSDQLPAIEWRDGFKLWYLHGVSFEYEVWKKIIDQDMTLPELAKLNLGADQRAVAIQMLRPDRLLEQMNAKLIATGKKYSKLLEQFGEDYCAANFPWSLNRPTELYQVDEFMGTSRTEYCMLMTHPSVVGKQYIEWVEPGIGKKADADLCQAHAFGMAVEEYFNAVEA